MEDAFVAAVDRTFETSTKAGVNLFFVDGKPAYDAYELRDGQYVKVARVARGTYATKVKVTAECSAATKLVLAAHAGQIDLEMFRGTYR